MNLTHDLLKEYFDYREDGNLIWKKKRGRGGQGMPGTIAGSVRKDGYIEVGFGGRHLLHRLIFMYHHGYVPDLIDHKDTNNTNNRIENLVESDKIKNGHNSYKGYGTVKYPGVHLNKNNKFVATICVNYKSKYLGSFDTAEDAYEIYLNEKMKILHN